MSASGLHSHIHKHTCTLTLTCIHIHMNAYTNIHHKRGEGRKGKKCCLMGDLHLSRDAWNKGPSLVFLPFPVLAMR